MAPRTILKHFKYPLKAAAFDIHHACHKLSDLCYVSAKDALLYHFHYALHTVGPTVTPVCSFVILSFIFSKLSLQFILTSAYYCVFTPLTPFMHLCISLHAKIHMCTCVRCGKRRGRWQVCTFQDTETRALHLCMCTSERGVVLLYVSALKADRARKKKKKNV